MTERINEDVALEEAHDAWTKALITAMDAHDQVVMLCEHAIVGRQRNKMVGFRNNLAAAVEVLQRKH